ncbi:flagellar basal body-associated FliL family protein [Dyella subtropica]|uniref:flagellar basal body-associated FliL family protein n=1 Tax=Dyella subtropica TaxID=2992127 RepID=UPI0022517992|nr:flagellar basal body-associated FliL family protein [Dyella subtropica]
MSTAEASPVEAPVIPPRSHKGTMLILLVALLVVSAVCGYALFTLRSHAAGTEAKVDAKAAEAKPKQPELYLALDPAFVVNFHNEQALSYLQVGVTLMSHDAAALQAVKDADPVIRNALVMLFSNQNYVEISDAAGKQKLQAKALQAVQKILQDRTGKPGVDALYFTSFVMQ